MKKKCILALAAIVTAFAATAQTQKCCGVANETTTTSTTIRKTVRHGQCCTTRNYNCCEAQKPAPVATKKPAPKSKPKEETPPVVPTPTPTPPVYQPVYIFVHDEPAPVVPVRQECAISTFKADNDPVWYKKKAKLSYTLIGECGPVDVYGGRVVIDNPMSMTMVTLNRLTGPQSFTLVTNDLVTGNLVTKTIDLDPRKRWYQKKIVIFAGGFILGSVITGLEVRHYDLHHLNRFTIMMDIGRHNNNPVIIL